ncbi:hypothetical protein JOF56_003742 [Kibdelosporangium banguiense]|uniref:Head-to-tail stopper n=1 Tax=Kibdelosporangium banguiense TaxID=1365924 RepID=A0ABS4TG10_9PSEU|nr:hypothetical protein [Kibdelosporangium banguiense]MBP2323357.1 hypothetical protein [Kibdelosporangium banguiense]
MSFKALFEQNLFKVRRYGPGPKDPLGKPTRVVLSETTVDGILQQTGSVEGEAFVVNEFRATMPLGTDLRPADDVVSKGHVYTVEGKPFAAVVPKTKIGVVTAILKYVGPVTA